MKCGSVIDDLYVNHIYKLVPFLILKLFELLVNPCQNYRIKKYQTSDKKSQVIKKNLIVKFLTVYDQ
jgi:hypothetical protein